MPGRDGATTGRRDLPGVLSARILGVARELFAQQGWAGTTIRAVAREAGVDPALVYHYFGTKEALLDVCTTFPPEWFARVAATWAAPRDQLAERLVRNSLAMWGDAALHSSMRATLLTAAHDPRTREKLKAIITGPLLAGPPGAPSVPGAPGAEPDPAKTEWRTRAGLVHTQLLGLAFVRYIWRIEPIASMSEEEVVAALAPTLQRYLDGDVGNARGRRSGARPAGSARRSPRRERPPAAPLAPWTAPPRGRHAGRRWTARASTAGRG